MSDSEAVGIEGYRAMMFKDYWEGGGAAGHVISLWTILRLVDIKLKF